MASFSVVPVLINDRLIVRLPESVSALLPSRGMNMGEGEIDGTAFIVPLEPDGEGGHWFSVADLIGDIPTIQPGKPLDIELVPAATWPDPVLPQDMEAAFRELDLLSFWDSLTVKAKWEWCRWIRGTANPETRKKRIGVASDKMAKGDRRPCCFNSASCTVPDVSKSGILITL